MKKILSLAMSVIMLMGLSVSVFAENDDGHWTENRNSTNVEYAGQGVDGLGEKKPDGLTPDVNGEGYLITVPMTFILSGDEIVDQGEVKVEGVWCSNCKLQVEVPKQVVMSTDLNKSEQIPLDITFSLKQEDNCTLTTEPNYSWVIDGNNQELITSLADISVENMTALFGTWTGIITYEVTPLGDYHNS